MKSIFILFVVVALALPSFAQVTVTGRVIDAENEPLPSVIVGRYGTGSKLRGYASSNCKGYFAIKAEVGDTLRFSMLGFNTERIVVKEGMQPLSIQMSSSAIELEEVTVKSDKVHERGDTVSYIVGAFANSADRSIGDVIAKMPGFDVDKKSGKISYEGKAISKFYIEGLDMLGGKYGTATNTLPQGEVGSVEVMRHHQPIHVLEDFTYTDDAAVNIKMKNSAKSRWVTSWKIGGGYGDNHSEYAKGDQVLWSAEGFGLRLKRDLQTMLTYKTNNTGIDIGRESTSLFDVGAFSRQISQKFILLSPPSVSNINVERSNMNRSHAMTANLMKRLSDDAQVNLQVVYNNDRNKAWGQHTTEYARSKGNRVILNSKMWQETNNNLYALLKYEHNSAKSYLRNSLSGEMQWLSDRLSETGTNPHRQYAKIPVYDFRDDLYLIRRWGKKLVSFYSYNTLQNRPQHLYVDSLSGQALSQRFYSTDTYAMGGWQAGAFSLSMKVGIKGLLRYIDSSAYGLPDSIGMMRDKSSFGYAKVYVEPKVEYSLADVRFTLSVPFEDSHYKYSTDDGRSRFDVSPNVNVRWKVTSRFTMSMNADYSVAPLDFNRFHGAFIMQDYLYLNGGFNGYAVSKSKTLRWSFIYHNSLKGTHLVGSLSRSQAINPYTLSRTFVGDYILLGIVPMSTKENSWTSMLMYHQGLPWLSGKLTMRGLYNRNNSEMMQDNMLVASQYNMLSASANLYLSPYKDMSVTYSLQYGYNDMKAQDSERTSFISWQHEMSIVLPLRTLRFRIDGEYHHNKIGDGQHKNIFFTDVNIGYYPSRKHFDLELKVSNIFNKKEYSYATIGSLMTMLSSTAIRGREILLQFIYKM